MTFTYALLGLAIVTEVTGTLALRSTDGFSKLGPSLVVVVCYVLAFVLLSFVLKRGLPVAVAYALWSAAGIVVIAVIGELFLKERLTLLQGFGMALIVVGVVTLELGTRAPTQLANERTESMTGPTEAAVVDGPAPLPDTAAVREMSRQAQ